MIGTDLPEPFLRLPRSALVPLDRYAPVLGGAGRVRRPGRVAVRLDPPVGRAKTVHALWDGEIVNSMGEGNEALAADLNRQIESWSTKRQQALAAGDPEDWAWESHTLALKFVYKRLHIPKEPVEFPTPCSAAPAEIAAHTWRIPPGYVQAMQTVVRAQLEKAGLRLARLLNESL